MATPAITIIQRRRSRVARKHVQAGRKRFWLGLFIVLFLVLFILPIGAVVGSAVMTYTDVTSDLPTPQDSLAAFTSDNVTRFYDREGITLLYSLQDPLGEDRAWVELETLSPYVQSLTLLMEDPDFLQSTRFNAFNTLTQLWGNWLVETAAPDLSITGRLVRNVISPPPLQGAFSENDTRTREIALAAEINRRYTPADVLEWHLNTEYYGNEAYGIEAAARIYLGKRAVDLTLAEAALLAPIPNAPQYNPLEDEEAARGRQLDALRLLFNAGDITQSQFEAAASEQIATQRGQYVPQLAPDFTAYAREQAEFILSSLGYDGRSMVARGGLTITTTLDADLYLQSECTLRAQLSRLRGATSTPDALDGTPCTGTEYLPSTPLTTPTIAPDTGTLVVLDAETGEIRALFGRATSADYQPGVTLQPFVYLDAFVHPADTQSLASPARMVLDVPLSLPGAEEGLIYTVNNPNGEFYGPLNLRDAMGAALLSPAADIAYRQGMSSIIRTAHQIGLNGLSEDIFDPMLLERGSSISPLDLAYAYSVFATLGYQFGVPVEPIGRGYRGRDPVAVAQITDANGNILWQYDPAASATITLESGIAYVINDIYADQETRWRVLGQQNSLNTTRPAAVVNGLAGDGADNWTVGYTPQYVVAVHLGRLDRQTMSLSPYGLEGAAHVWRAIIEYVHTRDTLPVSNWERPITVFDVPVCQLSGLRPNGVCPTYTEVFADGTQPRQVDTYWRMVEINNSTGQLATANTPLELRSEQRYFVPPDEALEWWTANNMALPPVEPDTMSIPQQFSTVRIEQPQAFSYLGGEVAISGSMDSNAMSYYQLSYGEGFNPTQWIDIGGQQSVYTPDQPLALWDTTTLENGIYSLRLVLARDDSSGANTYESAAVQVTVDNLPPTLELRLLEPERIYRFPADREIALEALVDDNLQTARVEFFVNGQLLGADESWPFQLAWPIDAPGTVTFSATVYDAVGNSASADLEVEVLRAG